MRTRAVGICHSDAHLMHGLLPMLPPPAVLGHEVAGIEATAALQRGEVARSVVTFD